MLPTVPVASLLFQPHLLLLFLQLNFVVHISEYKISKKWSLE